MHGGRKLDRGTVGTWYPTDFTQDRRSVGAVFFETKKTANTVTQGPEFAEAWGLSAGLALCRSS